MIFVASRPPIIGISKSIKMISILGSELGSELGLNNMSITSLPVKAS